MSEGENQGSEGKKATMTTTRLPSFVSRIFLSLVFSPVPLLLAAERRTRLAPRSTASTPRSSLGAAGRSFLGEKNSNGMDFFFACTRKASLSLAPFCLLPSGSHGGGSQSGGAHSMGVVPQKEREDALSLDCARGGLFRASPL